MGTNTETQEQIEALSAMMGECLGCVLIDDKEGWGSGCRCEGTDQVALFPSLRRECPCIWGTQGEVLAACTNCTLNAMPLKWGGHAADCSECQGKRWLPVALDEVDLGKLLAEDIRHLDWEYRIQCMKNEEVKAWIWPGKTARGLGKAATPAVAVIAARREFPKAGEIE